MNRARTVSAIAAVAVGALTLSGCAAAESGESGDALAVVATTTQVADFTSAVGGDAIALTALLSPGASAHSFDPTPADMIALGDADVLVINGMELETFLDTAIETSGFSGTIIDASEHLHADSAMKPEATTVPTSESTASEEEHAGEEHAEEGHDHAHDGENPHIWTSPVMAKEMVHSIAEGLSAADPAQAELFAANAEAYEEQLTVLDAWVAENIAQVPAAERLFVSGHDAMEYYLDEYEITSVGSILPSFEDNAEPSVAEINELVERIRELGVPAIFVESSLSPKLAEAIAEQTGATLLDDRVLYVDSLGAEGTGAETYVAATILNTQTLLEAWGYTPTPVPNELR